MTTIKRSALVAFSSRQMYQLVNDVQMYPQFLPGCSDALLISETKTEMIARLEISKLGIKHAFVTRNQLIENNKITLNLEQGPFKTLYGEWVFIEVDHDCCQIEFRLTFEFSNQLIAFAFGPVFKELTNNIVVSFIKRAKQIYNS